MSQLLPVFRAARLVGVTRGTMQKKIHDGELTTFEGMVALEDLLKLFPQTEVGYDKEYERIQNIKSNAFAKRVTERLLPDVTVLARRVAELGRDLAASRVDLARDRAILDEIKSRLGILCQTPTKELSEDILHWLEKVMHASSFSDQISHELLAQDTVLRIMSAHITIQPSHHEYWLDGNETLLDAGVRSGLALNYGCTSGNCGLCKARVINGEVKKIQPHDYVLSEAEKNMNYILMCSCTAVTDTILEALVAEDENDIPLQEIITKIKSVDTSHPETLLLHLQTPRTQRLRFLAGQSVMLSMKNGSNADFHIASCPCDDRNLIFHISRQHQTPFIEHLLANSRKGDEITVIGPHGDFLFEEESTRAPIFLAYGSGFAPIKSLIEHAMALEVAAAMHIYWAVPDKTALYAHNLCRSWADALEDFYYHPMVNEDPLEKILAAHKTIDAFDIYLAGPEANVNAATERLLAAGLPEKQLTSVNVT